MRSLPSDPPDVYGIGTRPRRPGICRSGQRCRQAPTGDDLVVSVAAPARRRRHAAPESLWAGSAEGECDPADGIVDSHGAIDTLALYEHLGII